MQCKYVLVFATTMTVLVGSVMDCPGETVALLSHQYNGHITSAEDYDYSSVYVVNGK